MDGIVCSMSLLISTHTQKSNTQSEKYLIVKNMLQKFDEMTVNKCTFDFNIDGKNGPLTKILGAP